ncbi:MAG: hypothetical protein ACRDJ0_10745 [Actinomycetota bacterium]
MAGALWAHPLTEAGALPFSPLTAAALGVMGIVLFATLTHPPRAEGDDASEVEADPQSGSIREDGGDALGPARLATRALALIVFLLAIAVGRLGSAFELENLAPVLLIGVAWPGVVIACAFLGRVWPWLDPFDTLARALGGLVGDREGGSRDVLWAAFPALAWTWYLSAYPSSLTPRTVGAVAALYTIVVVAACLAWGRRRVLERAEPFGIFYGLVGGFRAESRTWTPPRNADVLLAILLGGVLFGGLRQSTLWGALNASPRAGTLAAAGLLLVSALSVTFVWMAGRGRAGRRATVAVALVPVTAAAVVAVSMARNRLTTSAQLLPELLTHPFGDDIATLELLRSLDPNPLGTTGRTVLQMSLLVVGGIVGAVVVRRRYGTAANPAVAAVCVFTAVAVVAVSAV